MSARGRPYPLLACGDTCKGPKYTTRASVPWVDRLRQDSKQIPFLTDTVRARLEILNWKPRFP